MAASSSMRARTIDKVKKWHIYIDRKKKTGGLGGQVWIAGVDAASLWPELPAKSSGYRHFMKVIKQRCAWRQKIIEFKFG